MIVGNSHESPTVLPNRTTLAVSDITDLVSKILARRRTGKPNQTDRELFALCTEEFMSSSFSEIMKPMDDSVEAQYPEDVMDIFHVSILLSLRAIDPGTSPAECSILVFLLYIFVVCNDRVRARQRKQESLPSPHVRIPVAVVDVQHLTDAVQYFSQIENSLVPGMIKHLYEHHLEPRCMSPDLFINHSGRTSIRNNTADTLARQIAFGAETGRSVFVKEDDSNNPVLLNSAGETIIDPVRQMQGHPELQREILTIMSELCNVIPPPGESDEDLISEEERESALRLMPSQNVLMMLRDGRVSKRRKRSSPKKSNSK
jgi:hypothetical protein